MNILFVLHHEVYGYEEYLKKEGARMVILAKNAFEAKLAIVEHGDEIDYVCLPTEIKGGGGGCTSGYSSDNVMGVYSFARGYRNSWTDHNAKKIPCVLYQRVEHDHCDFADLFKKIKDKQFMRI